MRTLYCAVDTTGRFIFREPVTFPDQPHLARLAWVIADDADITSSWCRLIKPRDGWIYEDDAVAANGITPELAWEKGVALEYAMASFIGALDNVHRVVGFNIDFGQKVLQRSAFECGLGWQHLFNEHTLDCAMRRAIDIVRIPRMAPGGGFGWPKLAVACEFFTGEGLPPIDMDSVDRGIALARVVCAIDQGIVAHNKGVSHE